MAYPDDPLGLFSLTKRDVDRILAWAILAQGNQGPFIGHAGMLVGRLQSWRDAKLRLLVSESQGHR